MTSLLIYGQFWFTTKAAETTLFPLCKGRHLSPFFNALNLEPIVQFVYSARLLKNIEKH